MCGKAESRGFINIIDCIKGICAICVIILHADTMRSDDPFYILCTALAVPVFIILSGYNFAGGGKKPFL